MKAVNRAYDRLETRPFWKLRLIALVLVMATGLVLAGMFLLIVFGGNLGDAVVREPASATASSSSGTSPAGRSPSARCCSSSRSSTTSPRTSGRATGAGSRRALVGALLARALGPVRALHLVLELVPKTYGSIAGAIVLLLWLNYSAWAILFGAELNAALDRQADVHRPAARTPASSGRPAALVNATENVRRSFFVASERNVYLPA